MSGVVFLVRPILKTMTAYRLRSGNLGILAFELKAALLLVYYFDSLLQHANFLCMTEIRIKMLNWGKLIGLFNTINDSKFNTLILSA